MKNTVFLSQSSMSKKAEDLISWVLFTSVSTGVQSFSKSYWFDTLISHADS